MRQAFDEHGNLLCVGCDNPIDPSQFWIEVRQRHDVDSDAHLAVHIGCLSKLNKSHEKENNNGDR